MFSYINKQITEISSSKALSKFGLGLAFFHLWTVYSWHHTSMLSILSSKRICWPFFENCPQFIFTETQTFLILLIYLFISLISVASFIHKKPKVLYYSLLLLTIFQLLIRLIDYRFTGNYYYMPSILSFVFLLFPNKKFFTILTLVLFYVNAGFLKINTEWISGASLLRETVFSGVLLKASLVYVIYLEILFSPFLLSSKRKLFLFAFFQIILFHIFSWHIVGPYYPVVMLCLLYGVYHIHKEGFNLPKVKWHFIPQALYILLNGIKLIFFPNAVLSGEMKPYTLSMLDAYAVCSTYEFVKNEREIYELPERVIKSGVRTKCSPILVFQKQKHDCPSIKKGAVFTSSLVSKRSTDSPLKSSNFTALNLCNKPELFNIYGKLK